MRRARLKVPEDRPAGFYHCVSRVVDRRMIFDEGEKERFVGLMRECERFCRVRVLTYCLMSNHFHILVEVPRRPAAAPSPEEIVEALRGLSGYQLPEAVEQRLEGLREPGNEAALAAYLATFWARMYDVSAFMKLLKQRYTQSYNRRHGRRGTLWEERFKSVLVEGAGEGLAAMAAYIDLNPVRAGMVKDPKDYRWSGYGEAVGGRKRAKLGLQAIMRARQMGREVSVGRSLEEYRRYLYLKGDERREAVGPEGRLVRGALGAEEVAEVLVAKGRLPLASYLRCRVRYFCDGAVFGGREFVEEIFRTYRERFGEKRRTGARPVKGLAGQALFTVRDLRVNVFGADRAPG